MDRRALTEEDAIAPDKDERDEHETLLDVYMRAMDSAEPEPMKEAA